MMICLYYTLATERSVIALDGFAISCLSLCFPPAHISQSELHVTSEVVTICVNRMAKHLEGVIHGEVSVIA